MASPDPRPTVYLLDGGISTVLLARHRFSVPAAELLNLQAPSEVLRLHREYVEAGAHYLTTNTFGANPFRFRAIEPTCDLQALWSTAVRLALQAAAGRARVLGCVGPVQYYAERGGHGGQEQIRRAYRDMAGALLNAGCDGIVLETMPTTHEVLLALDAVAPLIQPGQMLVVSCYFRPTPTGYRTLDGVSAKDTLERLLKYPVTAAGANCCVGPAQMAQILEPRTVVSHGQGRWWAKPNAGLPTRRGDRLAYPVGPEAFAREVKRWVALGAGYVGGCCGAGPEHIAAMHRALQTGPDNLKRQ